jgi:hypothetical protein
MKQKAIIMRYSLPLSKAAGISTNKSASHLVLQEENLQGANPRLGSEGFKKNHASQWHGWFHTAFLWQPGMDELDHHLAQVIVLPAFDCHIAVV